MIFLDIVKFCYIGRFLFFLFNALSILFLDFGLFICIPLYIFTNLRFQVFISYGVRLLNDFSKATLNLKVYKLNSYSTGLTSYLNMWIACYLFCVQHRTDKASYPSAIYISLSSSAPVPGKMSYCHDLHLGWIMWLPLTNEIWVKILSVCGFQATLLRDSPALSLLSLFAGIEHFKVLDYVSQWDG